MKWMEGLEPRTEEAWSDYLDGRMFELMAREYTTTAEFLENMSDGLYALVSDEFKELFMDVLKDCDMVVDEEE